MCWVLPVLESNFSSSFQRDSRQKHCHITCTANHLQSMRIFKQIYLLYLNHLRSIRNFKQIYFLIVLKVLIYLGYIRSQKPCVYDHLLVPFAPLYSHMEISPVSLNFCPTFSCCCWKVLLGGNSHDTSHPVVKISDKDLHYCQWDYLCMYRYCSFCFSHRKYYPIDLAGVKKQWQIQSFMFSPWEIASWIIEHMELHNLALLRNIRK